MEKVRVEERLVPSGPSQIAGNAVGRKGEERVGYVEESVGGAWDGVEDVRWEAQMTMYWSWHGWYDEVVDARLGGEGEVDA